MEYEQHPDESDSVLLMKWLYLPVDISEWILEESGDVLECSPLLSHVSWLTGRSHELCEVSISFLGKSSILKVNKGKGVTFRSCQRAR